MTFARSSCAWTACLGFLFVAAACSEPRCPRDQKKMGSQCFRIDAGDEEGVGDAAESVEGREAVAADDDGASAMLEAGTSESWDGADAVTEAGVAPAIAEANTPCSQAASKACVGENSTTRLLCLDGSWSFAGSCERDTRCDSKAGPTQGTCQAVVPACLSKQPGETACDGAERRLCGRDLLSATPQPCPVNASCVDDGSVRCACDDGFEDEGGGGCRNIDDCPGNLCMNGSACVDGVNTYTCDCAGTGATGSRCENLVSECANAAVCSAGYPCVKLSAGETCLGQFADWPMPDSTPGAAAPPSYQALDAQRVRDNVTGLVWQIALPETYEGCTGQATASRPVGSGCSLEQAKAYCSNLVWGGQSDWRLPSLIELTSIHDTYQTGQTAAPVFDVPYVRTGPGNPSGGSPGGILWSGSTAPAGDQTWVVSFFPGGGPFLSAPDMGRTVRCVRGLPKGVSSDRYLVDAAAGEVLDTRTGLRWQKAPENGTVTTTAAAAACAAHGAGWRLPGQNELYSLIDPTRGAPMIDPAFTGTAERYWTATTLGFNQGYIDFATASSGFSAENSSFRARCVR